VPGPVTATDSWYVEFVVPLKVATTVVLAVRENEQVAVVAPGHPPCDHAVNVAFVPGVAVRTMGVTAVKVAPVGCCPTVPFPIVVT